MHRHRVCSNMWMRVDWSIMIRSVAASIAAPQGNTECRPEEWQPEVAGHKHRVCSMLWMRVEWSIMMRSVAATIAAPQGTQNAVC